MHFPLNQRRSLLLLVLVCLFPLVYTVGAFIVNIEVALRIFWPGIRILSGILPQNLYAQYTVLAADLSAVSTLIPLLMLLYPLVQAIRILRQQENDPGFAQRLEAAPYPPHFGFFMIMLGLTGTLYGMLIGLNVSGVAELAGKAPTPDAIRRSLDRLLGGTATALLSSLVGLIGAFFASNSVIPAVFRWAAGISDAESSTALSDTVEQLNRDLRALGQASQTFAACLQPKLAESLFERMEKQEAVARSIVTQLEQVNNTLLAASAIQQDASRRLEPLQPMAAALTAISEKIGQTNAALEAIERNQVLVADRLQPLEPGAQAAQAAAAALGAGNQLLAGLEKNQQHSNALLNQSAADGAARHQEILRQLATMIEAAQSHSDHLQRDQQALRLALAAYLQPDNSARRSTL